MRNGGQGDDPSAWGDRIMGIVRTSQIKSIGRGTIAVNDANLTATATISAVVTSKTILTHLGSRSATNNSAYTIATLELTDTTTITATRGATDGTADVIVSYQYMEYH